MIDIAAARRTAKTLDSVIRHHFGRQDSEVTIAAVGMWLGMALRHKGMEYAEEFLFWLGEDVIENSG